MPRLPGPVWMLVIAGIVVFSSAFMFLVTTFLFAFSGGQYRMVAVVNSGVLVMIAVTLVASVVAWLLRGGAYAAVVAALTAVMGWVATVVVEFVISFWLGA